MAKSSKGSRRIAAKAPKTPKVRIDRGTMQTRLYHARAFLGIADSARLEMLVNIPAERLHAEGEIEVPKPKRIQTEQEEWEAIGAAVHEERERLFAKAASAPHMAQRKDPIGRAWFEGLLEGYGVDSAVLRELGREYGGLYWGELKKLDASIGGYDEMLGRSNIKRTFQMPGLSGGAEKRFDKFENALLPLGHEVRKCLQKLCADDIWWSNGPAWLDRCINSHRQGRRDRGEKSDPPFGDMARGCDLDILNRAISGLCALATGVGR